MATRSDHPVRPLRPVHPNRDFSNAAVAQVFADWPAPIRRKLLAVRELIFKTADRLPHVGEIEETLKWGEPAYLTPHSKSGSTIRLAWKPSAPSQYGIYFNCQTRLVDTFRTIFPSGLKFEGNRAIVLDDTQIFPKDAIAVCIGQALTYHLKSPVRTGTRPAIAHRKT